MFQNWQDLKELIANKAKALAPDANVAPGGRGGKGAGRTRAKTSPADSVPFAEAWKSHCAMNQRLRDPRALGVLVRRGVPDDLRSDVWGHCLGVEVRVTTAEAILQPADEDDSSTVVQEPNSNEQPELPVGLSELIDADVSRTFPSLAEFKSGGGAERLRRLLRTLAVTDVEIGYCQSLNFLTAMFMMRFAEDQAVIFAVGKTLTKLNTRRWYSDGMQQLRADTLVLEGLIQEWLPDIHAAFLFHKFDLIFVSSKWFLCLFATVLEGEALKRVWDIMLCDGIEAVFRISLALLARKEDQILKIQSHDDLLFLFQEGQADACPHAIVHAAYDPNLIASLSRAKLSEKRQQAMSQVSSTDTRSEMRRQHLWRGGVRPASVLAR